MTDISSLPRHVGIIMDGNGRWAKNRGLKRSAGHKEGLNSAKRIVKKVSSLGIPYLSLYVFSTENWKRTEDEISFLMQLIRSYLRKEFQFYLENQIRVKHSGDLERLPKDVQVEINDICNRTSAFTGLTVNLLINYGGKNEIMRAVERLISAGFPENLSEEDLDKHLDHPEIPPLDLVIRSAGEQRLSNFMVWQAAYAEYIFLKELWPDFTEETLISALDEYSKRKRKFGGMVNE